MKNLATLSSIFIFISSSSTGELCSQPIGGNVRRIFPEHVEQSILDPEYSFVAVRRIFRFRFVKQKLVQLRTNYVDFRFDENPELFAKEMLVQLRTGYSRSSIAYLALYRQRAKGGLMPLGHLGVSTSPPHRPHITSTSPPLYLTTHVLSSRPSHRVTQREK